MRASTAFRILVAIVAVLGLSALISVVSGSPDAREAVGGFMFVAVVIGGLSWLSYRYRVLPRRGSFADQARAAGLRAQAGDPHGLLELPFALFGRTASVRAIENVASGVRRGENVVVADYWYAPTSAPEYDDYLRFTCVLMDAPGWWPDLLVAPEGLVSRLRSTFALPDIELESEEFNRRFEVRSSERRFANALLDARMMLWLLEQVPGVGFEVSNGHLLLFRPRVTASLDDVERSLDLSDGFFDHVPRLIRAGPF